ncbi:MAG: chromosome segregation protein SMC [Oscillospiraceae bacterium]|nr:chromosome segregation protein SMC [Oscillospiraceae bacterium]
MFTLYLKSLEIQGFKSFPTHTRLTFDKPITGIVGPNGSGKSNVSDALMWVMGEQSTKNLRGGKMEDVIFGGTVRRPQLGFAEVSLILDNSDNRLNLDTSEVMLTRRYYRSGESEYYINQSLVRLKDVTELLMDTGLGREGYCIIGQGRIAEILSTKSKDRREIFEEAAGISRYRHRKEESERKLSQTDENLLRIGDKISELQMQYDTLGPQAEVAKKFLLLSGEKRGIEISLWLNDLENLTKRAERADEDFVAAERQLDAAQIQLESIYSETEALAEMTRESDVETESVRELVSASEGKYNEVDNSINVLKTQLESNTDQIENLSIELKSHDDQTDGVGGQISENEDKLSQISKSKSEKDAKIKKVISELQAISDSTGESNETHSALIRQEQELASKQSEQKSEFSALASQAQELLDMDESVKQELAAAKEEHKLAETEHENLNAELVKAQEETTSLENVIGGLTLKAQNRIKKADTLQEKFDRLSFELKTLHSRKNLLSEMEKDFQGYSKSVKIIMQEHSRGSLKNIHGTVGNLIKTDNDYAVAIETALGGAMQNIIVDTEDDGKAAINHLKRRDGGRATFLPISTVKGDVLNAGTLKNDAGFVGLALDLVSFDEKYRGVYARLLGRVVIADDLSSAVNIAKKHGHKFKIVTLDGQVMNAGGSMTGGSSASNVGVLSRANELSQLDSKIKSCNDDVAAAERELAECVRERTAAEYELSTAQSELQMAREENLKCELEKSHREQNLQSSKERMETLTDEFNSFEARIDENSAKSDELKKEIVNIETQLQQIRASIDDAVLGHEKLAEQREKTNGILAALRAEVAGFDAEIGTLKKNVSDLCKIRDDMSGNRERQLETISGLNTRNERICIEISQKEQELLKISDEITKHKERLNKIGNRKLEIEAKRNNIGKDMQSKNDELLKLQRVCSRLEQEKQAIEMEEQNINDKLWDTYELSKSSAVSQGTPIDDVKATQKRLNKLKHEITELGTPNIGAIDEFDRVSTRYDFLTEQRDDVEKAKAELIDIITRITAEMCEIFSREFAVINENFGHTFKQLFGGGRASLLLEDPEDVLGSGIEIQVQPPGKSLKNLSLLSGGEKAFVAIAIYFAILGVRPPPFVVMDEIDAALDDANVVRFADYMRLMSDRTQMIVITHKRGTMEEADVLYGVTMQELGVSSILCVDVEEAEKAMRTKVAVR